MEKWARGLLYSSLAIATLGGAAKLGAFEAVSGDEAPTSNAANEVASHTARPKTVTRRHPLSERSKDHSERSGDRNVALHEQGQRARESKQQARSEKRAARSAKKAAQIEARDERWLKRVAHDPERLASVRAAIEARKAREQAGREHAESRRERRQALAADRARNPYTPPPVSPHAPKLGLPIVEVDGTLRAPATYKRVTQAEE